MMKQFNLLYVFSLLMAFSLVSCSGEDGTDGADGDPGAPGTNGINGTNGTDGENGVGFDELTKYGHLTMVLEGTRIDGVEFRDSTAFKFTPISGDNIPVVNQLFIDDEEPDVNYDFRIIRFLSSPDDLFQERYVRFNLNIDNIEDESKELQSASIVIRGHTIIGDDNKYFVVDMDPDFESFELDSPGVSDFEVTEITFDPETNHLTFSYSLNVDAENNVTEHDLHISGTADVFVLESLDDDGVVIGP
ncbi:MAG: hypothetical protein AB3N18_15140 [Allomuricauda sp.]